MSWTETNSGRYQRAIGENEMFIKLIGDPGHVLDREHWAINAIAVFTPRGTFAQGDFSDLFLKAWKNLRFWHPSIAARAIDEHTLEYTVPNSEALIQWAAETFSVVKDRSGDEIILDLKPSPLATLTYLAATGEILFHTAHWRTDGIGVLSLLDVFFELAVDLTLPDPGSLAWGDESARLAPAVEDAAGMPTVSTEAMKDLAQNCADTFSRAAGATGIPYKGEDSTMPGGTRSSRLALSVSETSGVVSQCKARDLSVTSAVHASVGMANRICALEINKGKHYTSTIRFSLRPYLPKPYCTPAFAAGLYTTGWMKAIPASASWMEHAQAYNEEYRNGLSAEFIQSHRQYAIDLGNLIRDMPQGGDPPSDVDISSIGVAEHLIARSKGSLESGVEIQAVSVGVEILTRQCVCFVWTFRDRLHLNLVYNQSFHDERDTAYFLQQVKHTLLHELSI